MRTELVQAGVRWLKFNLVGALGIGVQLGVLGSLTEIWHVGYFFATALAVEAAVMHNFVWHEKFTWVNQDTRRLSGAWRRLCWFHATNGALSIGGNLLLMRWLVGQLHISPVLANLVSISGCSVASFVVCDKWVFRPRLLSPPRASVRTGHEGREAAPTAPRFNRLRVPGSRVIYETNPVQDH